MAMIMIDYENHNGMCKGNENKNEKKNDNGNDNANGNDSGIYSASGTGADVERREIGGVGK